MPSDHETCCLCGENAQRESSRYNGAYRFLGCACGEYFAITELMAQEEHNINAGKYERLPPLLRERQLKGDSVPLLVFSTEQQSIARKEPNLADPVLVPELLAQWPSTVPDRIERSFVCLVRAAGPDLCAGEDIEFSRDGWRRYLPFALNATEQGYFLDALSEYGWIRHKPAKNYHLARPTPKGWEKYHELTGSRGDVRNPVFVAMWFGKKKPDVDRSAEMKALFLDVIRSACLKAGWEAVRADSREHNEPIMGKILEWIRKAPFVIAELTDNNAGVFYEAGFALGQGKEVIYCRQESQKVHFDVSAINQVVWKDNEDLAKRLYDRILETQKEGPFVNRGPGLD